MFAEADHQSLSNRRKSLVYILGFSISSGRYMVLV
jgi:hypothetical protein